MNPNNIPAPTLRAELLDAICADPDNDASRLVYADYLLSQPGINDQRRGRLIALQCSSSPSEGLDKQVSRLKKYIPDLIREELPIDLSNKTLLQSTFRRGFLYGMQLTYFEWLRSRRVLMQHTPRLESLHMYGQGAIQSEDIEFYKGLTSFTFRELFYPYGDMVRKLLEATPEAIWQDLHLHCGRMEHFPSVPRLPCLKKLFLLSRENATAFPSLALGWLERLAQLELYNMVIDADMIAHFSPDLKIVTLGGCTIHENMRLILGDTSMDALSHWFADRSIILRAG